MTTEKLLKQTFYEQYNAAIFVVMFISIAVLSAVYAGSGHLQEFIITGDHSLFIAFPILGGMMSVFAPLLIYMWRREVNRDQTVDLFMGELRIDKLVQLSMEYLGYKTTPLKSSIDPHLTYACMIVDDDHLVYACHGELNLERIDNVCKLANDKNIKKINIVMDWDNLDGISGSAKKVAKQHGIMIYKKSQLYDVMNRAIKSNGGDPIRECVC